MTDMQTYRPPPLERHIDDLIAKHEDLAFEVALDDMRDALSREAWDEVYHRARVAVRLFDILQLDDEDPILEVCWIDEIRDAQSRRNVLRVFNSDEYQSAVLDVKERLGRPFVPHATTGSVVEWMRTV